MLSKNQWVLTSTWNNLQFTHKSLFRTPCFVYEFLAPPHNCFMQATNDAADSLCVKVKIMKKKERPFTKLNPVLQKKLSTDDNVLNVSRIPCPDIMVSFPFSVFSAKNGSRTDLCCDIRKKTETKKRTGGYNKNGKKIFTKRHKLLNLASSKRNCRKFKLLHLQLTGLQIYLFHEQIFDWKT